jgi:ADP-ribose pyrophosphatase YjhB (NUDIX family)
MLKQVLEAVWLHLPSPLRHLIVRTAQSRFTISAGAVVLREDGHVLLLQHRFRPGGFSLGIPGGFLGRGEDADVALRRELREETGLELTDLELLTTRTFRKHLEIIFVARASGEAKVGGWEIAAAEWYDPQNLPAKLNRSQRELIDRAVEFVKGGV